jgi:hypothetical protein
VERESSQEVQHKYDNSGFREGPHPSIVRGTRRKTGITIILEMGNAHGGGVKFKIL